MKTKRITVTTLDARSASQNVVGAPWVDAPSVKGKHVMKGVFKKERFLEKQNMVLGLKAGYAIYVWNERK